MILPWKIRQGGNEGRRHASPAIEGGSQMLKIHIQRLAASAAALGLALAAHGAQAQMVSGPIPGHITLGRGAFDQPPPGYTVEEFFLSGTASGYTVPGVSASDGKWRAQASSSAAYKTRLVVARPAPDKFNGVVIVEWLNVTAGADGGPDWGDTHRELTRKGYAYVAVSAQQVGVEGGAGAGIPGSQPLKKADPQRYGSLVHPGDAYAYDIFSQAGEAVRDPKSHLLGPLKPRRVLATGESQSAAFLVTYIDAVDPLARVFDGFLVHSRFKGGAPLNGDFASSMTSSAESLSNRSILIRSDVRVPVLLFETETDLFAGPFGYLSSRQPDTDRIRTWEVAGTAHADTYAMAGTLDTGSAPPEALAKAFTPVSGLFGMAMAKPVNAAPQHHYVLEAAISALDAWVATGKAPPSAPRLKITDATPAVFVLDKVGNAEGGIRSPWEDAPIYRYSGLGQPGGGIASLFGSTEPLDAATLASLYPRGRADYLARFAPALDAAIRAGFILPDDRSEILAVAAVMYPGS
jgi:hypothetical protein